MKETSGPFRLLDDFNLFLLVLVLSRVLNRYETLPLGSKKKVAFLEINCTCCCSCAVLQIMIVPEFVAVVNGATVQCCCGLL